MGPLASRSLVIVAVAFALPAHAAPPPVGFAWVEVRDPTRTLIPPRDAAGRPAGDVQRRLRVGLWYPAANARSGAALRWVDLDDRPLEERRTQLSALAGPAFDAQLFTARVRESAGARRGARPAAARVPLVLLPGGDPFEMGALAERIARLGYAVAAIPPRGRAVKPLLGGDDPVRMEAMADDVALVQAALRGRRGVDADRYALVAFSLSATVAVLHEMRAASAAALISLDGWDARPGGITLLRQSASLDPARIRAPWLYLRAPEQDPLALRDFGLIRAAGGSDRTVGEVPGLRHFDLVPMHELGGNLPASSLRAARLADDAIAAFLRTHLSGTPTPLPEEIKLLEHHPATRAPLRDEVLYAAFERHDASALARSSLDEAELNDLGYTLLRSGRGAEAISVLGAAAERFPSSWNAHDSLGEALLATGDQASARAAYARALGLNPNARSAREALAKLGTAPPPASAGPRLGTEPVVYRAPGTDRVQIRAGIPWCEGCVLDLYRPADALRVPVVVFINGVTNDERNWRVYQDWGRLVAAQGLAAVIYAAPALGVEDARAALSWVRAHALELGVDPERVLIWSCSANVGVGSRVAALEDQPWLRGAVFYYGVMEAATVRPDLPALVVRAGRDAPALNRTIDRWVRQAMSVGAPLELVHAPALQHGFDVRDDVEESRALVRRTLEWMKERLVEPARTAAAR